MGSSGSPARLSSDSCSKAVDSSGGFEGDDLANQWKDGQPIPVAVALAVHVEDCVDAA